MENRLLKTIFTFSKFLLYGFVLQLLVLNFSPAMNVNHQFQSIEKGADEDPIKVTGLIKGEDGKSLPGVNILIKGSSIGTVTDLDGYYEINAQENDVLLFTYIGYL